MGLRMSAYFRSPIVALLDGSVITFPETVTVFTPSRAVAWTPRTAVAHLGTESRPLEPSS
jgi:hypothetical protein